jgi:NAD(P)-dependent dehydrogenase (short-subunit alcohol dehydrogenase family)
MHLHPEAGGDPSRLYLLLPCTGNEDFDTMPHTALVTGASSGIGESAALLLKEHGHTVYAAARRIDRMRPLEEKGIHVLPLDITAEASMTTCVNAIKERHGGVDILVNNAGYGSYGAVEDVPVDEGRRQFEVNLFGLARLTQLVLPHMREKEFGRIINITSMGGKIYTPFGAWYHATKHALEGWSDCLRIETQRFGIDVVIVEPGGIKTDWGLIAAENLRKTSGSGAYAVAANKAADGMATRYGGNSLSDPSVISKVILKAATARRPKTRYAAGYMARMSLFLRWLLTDRMFDRLIKSAA